MLGLVLFLSMIGFGVGLAWLAVNAFRKRPKKKPGIVAAVAFVAFVACVPFLPPPDHSKAKSAPVEVAEEKPIEAPTPTPEEKKAEEPPAAEPAPAPTEKSPAAALKEICQAEISKGDELVDVEVNEDMSKENFGTGKLIVLPKFKSNSGFRSSELMKAAKMIKAIYAAGYPVSEVTVFTQDMSGHTIMKCTMNEQRAASIDWSVVSYSEFDKYLSNFWAVPALRK